jgi:hypothetical protein
LFSKKKMDKCPLCGEDQRGCCMREVPFDCDSDFVCYDCLSDKYFKTECSLDIIMHIKKGWVYDYKKEGAKQRNFVKSKRTKEHCVSISYFELVNIEDDRELKANIQKIELYKDGNLIMSEKEDFDVLFKKIKIVPTPAYFDIKKKNLKEEIESRQKELENVETLEKKIIK